MRAEVDRPAVTTRKGRPAEESARSLHHQISNKYDGDEDGGEPFDDEVEGVEAGGAGLLGAAACYFILDEVLRHNPTHENRE